MCQVDDCKRPVRARGLCTKHYTRLMKHGSVDVVKTGGGAHGRSKSVCQIGDCTSPVVGREMCRKHYTRWRRTGDPNVVRRDISPVGTCGREGCGNSVKLHPSGPKKYCSPECYFQSGPKSRNYSARLCCHCSKNFTPTGARQKFCQECIGEPVRQPNGILYYPGQKRLLLYGVSWAEWSEMLAKHEGKCWICRTKDATALDHCHTSGQARGALCDVCNTRLHTVEDSGWLERALTYLKQSSGET